MVCHCFSTRKNGASSEAKSIPFAWQPGHNPSKPKRWPKRRASLSRLQIDHSTKNFVSPAYLKCEVRVQRFVCRWIRVPRPLRALTSASRKMVLRARRRILLLHPTANLRRRAVESYLQIDVTESN